MKVLIVYDSAYGNTEQIAKAIASAFSTQDNAGILRAGEVKSEQMQGAEVLIIGSPTNGGKATKQMLDFLNLLPESAIKSLKIAVFDTRLTNKMAGIFGYAAGKIADNLKKRGGNLILSPEGFFVKRSKGPLKEGELERAASWGKTISQIVRPEE
jgi:flavodoxin I